MLRSLAAKEYSDGHEDEPAASYKVEFAPLERTEEYKELSALETINLGDTVRVVHEADGFEITARMVSYRYDPLTRSYISVTLGNYSPRFTDVAKELKRVDAVAGAAVDEANFALRSANGKNANYYGTATPANPRKGDIWFKQNGDKTELWIYETRDGVTQWYALLTDLTQEELKSELEDAKAAVDGAVAAAEDAVAAGEAAQASAEEATGKLADLEEGMAYATELAEAASAAAGGFGSDIQVLTDCITMLTSGQTGLSLISLEPGTITIKADKINIDGTTNIANGVIKTAHIGSAAITTAKIADAAITNAKIANLDAGKINTGTLSADRIAAGSISSAKLSIANGFITNAMIADATIQSAKISSIDAAKITTGTLSASRIGAGTITADKLSSNAIQVGLAGWTSVIRITPSRLSWYSGDSLEGYIDSNGMNFYYGTRFIGMMGESYDTSDSTKRGIATHLNGQGDYATWAYRTGTSGNYTRFLTFDPKGALGGGVGIQFGTHLRLNGYNMYTSGGRGIVLMDNALTNVGTFPSLSYTSGGSRVTFSSSHLYLVTNGSFYNVSYLMSRVQELMSRVNGLINLLNNGWVKSITSGSNGSISWSYYSSTGWSTMSTALS
jgi:hypothetical protein